MHPVVVIADVVYGLVRPLPKLHHSYSVVLKLKSMACVEPGVAGSVDDVLMLRTSCRLMGC